MSKLYATSAAPKAADEFAAPRPSSGLAMLVAADVQGSSFAMPPLPVALVELSTIAESPEPDLHAACRTIERDPTLAGPVLAVASSAAYGPRPARDLGHAVLRLGARGLRDLCYALHLGRLFESGPRLASWMRRERLRAYPQARAAQATFQCLGLDVSLGFLAGLLADVGRLSLISMVSRYPATETIDDDRLAGIVDVHHSEVGEAVVRRWQLTPELLSAVRFHHEPEAAIEHQAIALATSLACLAVDTLELIEDPEETRDALATLPWVQRAALTEEQLAFVLKATSDALESPLP